MSAVFYHMTLNKHYNDIELKGVNTVFNISAIREITVSTHKAQNGVAVYIECDNNGGIYSFELKLL